MAKAQPFRIAQITLDDDSISHGSPEVEKERQIAIYDLLEQNHFALAGSRGGPYHLNLSIAENRLVFDVRLSDGSEHGKVILSLTPFRRCLKDYFQLCDSYYAAIKDAPPSRIETVDMGRRGLHDEGSQLLMTRLKGKIEIDFDTARRLFTLICALHLKGVS